MPTVIIANKIRRRASNAQRLPAAPRPAKSECLSLRNYRLSRNDAVADRRRPGGSRRAKSVRSILTRAFGAPVSDSLALAKVLAPPHLNGVSRRDGGATTASFRLSGL